MTDFAEHVIERAIRTSVARVRVSERGVAVTGSTGWLSVAETRSLADTLLEAAHEVEMLKDGRVTELSEGLRHIPDGEFAEPR